MSLALLPPAPTASTAAPESAHAVDEPALTDRSPPNRRTRGEQRAAASMAQPGVVIETSMGQVTVELYWQHAPRTCR